MFSSYGLQNSPPLSVRWSRGAFQVSPVMGYHHTRLGKDDSRTWDDGEVEWLHDRWRIFLFLDLLGLAFHLLLSIAPQIGEQFHFSPTCQCTLCIAVRIFRCKLILRAVRLTSPSFPGPNRSSGPSQSVQEIFRFFCWIWAFLDLKIRCYPKCRCHTRDVRSLATVSNCVHLSKRSAFYTVRLFRFVSVFT